MLSIVARVRSRKFLVNKTQNDQDKEKIDAKIPREKFSIHKRLWTKQWPDLSSVCLWIVHGRKAELR